MTEAISDRRVPVAIGLVARGGQYLVRQRPPGTPMEGLWEFPGGKCEAGETPAGTVRRECREETGLDVVVGALRRRIEYRYPEALLELSFFDCTTADPLAEPRASTGFLWVAADDLASLSFPAANGPVVEELRKTAGLPPRA